ncbi:MAG TPA: hypothetical protein VEL77_15115 [Rugosimonospora sp.]|nr:hypothetical protein [Rugosimonospora sp.]
MSDPHRPEISLVADEGRAFSYMAIELDMGDLDRLCALGSVGWHCIAIDKDYALLEREIPKHRIQAVRQYYEERKTEVGQ